MLNGLPLKGIKKIMKTDADVQRISGDAPVFLAKACEMFIQELTLRAWHHTKQNKSRTLQRKDISVALATTHVFDFLVDISPLNKLEPEGAELPADPLLPRSPEVKVELKGIGMGLLRTNSVQPIVLQGNAAALPLAPPATTNKVMPNLHLENFKPVQNYMGSSPRTIDHNQVSFKHHHVFFW
jgi:histone H3/H4